MNFTQAEIIEKLRYRSFLSYNELWEKKGDSARCAYHLKELERKGLIEKKQKGYKLTLQGIKEADYRSVPEPQPLQVVVVVPKKEDKVLVDERIKYPFKGYQEFCASKLGAKETIYEAAQNRLWQKLGLKAEKITYKGIEFLQTKEENEMIMHHHLHIFLAEGLEGKEKKGIWMSIKNFTPKNPLPHIEQTLKIALHEGFTIAVTDLIKEKDKYVAYKTQKKESFT